jgi:flagellin-like hook-associated protein FlgL
MTTGENSYDKIDYDVSTFDIDTVQAPTTNITLQVGMYGADSSQINFDVGFNYNLKSILKNGCNSDSAYNTINNFMETLNEKSTQLGAIQNKLESALETTTVSMNNLVSSRSTIRDADIGEVSSDYIRQQILQQACATLISTANQSPAIALQLI